MPRAKKEAVAKATSSQNTPERFRLGEMGVGGLPIYQGVSREEIKQELNFPNSVYVYKEMSVHSAINAPLALFDNIISKATWTFKPPVDATEEEKKQCKIVESMMHDMEQPWKEFIRDVLSSNVFGFSVHEKVYRKRYKENGSLYDDGLIGWKKLPIRAQESITKFLFSDDGNELIGVQQTVSKLNNTSGKFKSIS